jgi:SprT-like family
MVQPISRGIETREQWLDRAIEMMRPEFAAAGAPLAENLAVSCSWPSGNPRTVIGECWVAEASSRGYVEVFISPVLDQVAGLQGVLVTLLHELVHAAGRRGHGKEFKALAVELGLTGPMTATVASSELLDFINWTLLPQLGQYPHGAITGRGEIVVPLTEPGDKPIILRPDDRPKKQATRMLKAECPECGYTIRLSKRWADVGLPTCPTDGAALALDGAGEANEGEGVHVLAPAAVRLT